MVRPYSKNTNSRRDEFSRDLVKGVARIMAEDGSVLSTIKAEKVVEAVLDHLKEAAIAVVAASNH